MNPQIAELQAQLDKLRGEIAELSGNFFKNNFTSNQIFNKDCTFSTRLRVPVYSSAPTVGEIGDIISVAGVLYICTTASPGIVFSKVGAQ